MQTTYSVCRAGIQIPVSYTHLDVYKRQLQEWVPEGTMVCLKEICEILGASRREVLERLVSEARDGRIELVRGPI